jgi:hypothetical protein
MEVWNWVQILLQNCQSIKTPEVVLSRNKDCLRRILNQQVVAGDKTSCAPLRVQSRLSWVESEGDLDLWFWEHQSGHVLQWMELEEWSDSEAYMSEDWTSDE